MAFKYERSARALRSWNGTPCSRRVSRSNRSARKTSSGVIASNRRGLSGFRHADFYPNQSCDILKSEWARVIVQHPKAYLLHRLEFARSYFGLRHRPQLGANYTGVPRIQKIQDEAPLLPQLSNKLINEFILPFIARHLSHCWMWTLVAMFAGWGACRQRKWREFALIMSAGTYILGNLAMAPSSPFRYHLPTVIMVIVVLPRILDGWVNRSNRSSSDQND